MTRDVFSLPFAERSRISMRNSAARKPGPWYETHKAVGTDTQTGETIYEVRKQRILPGGYFETGNRVIRWERK
jgi:hypothetical protein